MAYFANPMVLEAMPNVRVMQGGSMNMKLANLCPIPLAWAPYFMEFKAHYKTLKKGKALMATLYDVEQWMRASPMIDWLRATCVWLGLNTDDCHRSILNQGFEPTAPDVWVIKSS
jgi:hypothetical protein